MNVGTAVAGGKLSLQSGASDETLVLDGGITFNGKAGTSPIFEMVNNDKLYLYQSSGHSNKDSLLQEIKSQQGMMCLYPLEITECIYFLRVLVMFPKYGDDIHPTHPKTKFHGLPL